METSRTPSGPTLRAVKFSLAGATRMSADCGGVSATGTNSVLLRNLPSGTCQIRADVDGVSYATRVSVSRPAGLTCEVTEGALRCQ